MFGVNAELLIDHAWGYEPVTMADIKAYKPEAKSVGSGQALACPYDFDKARTVVWEMADQLALDLVGQRLLTNQLTLWTALPPPTEITGLEGIGSFWQMTLSSPWRIF